MRILYAADYYPHGTESYIEAEIQAALALAIDVQIWSMNSGSRLPHPVAVPVHSGQSLSDCIAEARPDVVHAYYLNIGAHLLEQVRATGVAYTIRAHGYEYSLDLLNRLAADRAVTRILVFPHMAADADPELRSKIAVLPTMYDAARYRTGHSHDRRLVVRVASAVRTKSIDQFMRTAKLCPDHRFVLALGQGFDFNFAAAADTKAVNAELGSPIEIRENLDWAAAACLVGGAGIYMYTPPTHRPGMPISVAEAMASGCLVLVPDIEGMRAYLGDSGGRLYRSVEEAAEIIRSTEAWSEAEWRGVEARSAAHAKRHYANTVLGRRLATIWEAATPRWVLERLDLALCYGVHAEMPEGPCPYFLVFGGNMSVRAKVIAHGLRFDAAFGPNGTRRYAMGDETDFVCRAEGAGFRPWHCRTALAGHFVPKAHMTERWVCNRARNFGRNQFKSDGPAIRELRGASDAVTAARLERAMAEERRRLWRALLARDGKTRFAARFRLNFLAGLAEEHAAARR